MTLNTPALDDEARAEELLLSVQDSLRDLRNAFKALKERADMGEDVKGAEIKSNFRDLGTVLVNCQKLETTLAEARQKRGSGGHGGAVLDLDAARAEVRCALGRIRACCRAGSVSE
ncbi:hypothetical protein [uncultured Tateyamaria sp.]|uniref:hypothetical protein n=1 Tax=uncultured Tateyamaria sp. TaxID=455651 RepID=UPI0026252762|nr:hypothetical protein [uncultured Tateyamaria sp.]